MEQLVARTLYEAIVVTALQLPNFSWSGKYMRHFNIECLDFVVVVENLSWIGQHLACRL